ncbi:MAG: DUF4922 domain-containing protein [Muribaculaceae bacterium]|nr:DUF4922 domain-containing protein [Muribaculaceae bacterium]
MKIDDIKNFHDHQVQEWPLAHKNYLDLFSVRKKQFKVNDLEGWVQYNPGRALSTLAKVDRKSIQERRCFLCEENRPPEQHRLELNEDFSLLVNPYPILPYHFTIPSVRHEMQQFSYATGCRLAKELPGMVVFYNDDGAGASAPDHLHYQAVPLENIPLIKLYEENKELELPFKILDERNLDFRSPVNGYFWTTEESDDVNFICIPRKKHRPDVFFKEGPLRRAVSPGALDMAGIIVIPYHEDFEAITNEDIKEIYGEVGYSPSF